MADLLNWVALFGLGLIVGGVGLLSAALATTRSRRRRKPRPRPAPRSAGVPRPQPPPAVHHPQPPDVRRSALLAETVLLDEVAPAWAQPVLGVPVPSAPPQQPAFQPPPIAAPVHHTPLPPPPALFLQPPPNMPPPARTLGRPGGSMPAVPLAPPIRPAHPLPTRGGPQRGPVSPPPSATSWDAFTPVRASDRPPEPEPGRLPERRPRGPAEPPAAPPVPGLAVRANAEAGRQPNERPFPPNGDRQPGQGNQGQTWPAPEPAGPRPNQPHAEPPNGEPGETNRRRPERGYRSRRGNPNQPAQPSGRRRPR